MKNIIINLCVQFPVTGWTAVRAIATNAAGERLKESVQVVETSDPDSVNMGNGTMLLANVPQEATHVSIQATAHLRRRLPIAPDNTVQFIGESAMVGVDFNGDNVCDSTDLNLSSSLQASLQAAYNASGDAE